MDDIQPYGYGEDARLVVTLGGPIARSELDFVVWTVVVIARGAALAVFRVVEFRIQMPTEPDESLEGLMEPVQKEVSHTNDQEGFPRDSENEEAACVEDDVSQTYP
jgi:hypothetical protein